MKNTVKHLLSAVCFLLIAALLFTFFTYLYRRNTKSGRINILNFYEEPEDTLDLIFIGASSVHRYFSPMQAYEAAGFTSFDYAVSSMREVSYLTAIEDILKRQNPQVILLDGRRMLTRVTDTGGTSLIRNYLDSLDLNLDRAKAVWKYVITYSKTLKAAVKKSVPFFLDLCLYHNNPSALLDPMSWSLSDNRMQTPVSGTYPKGFGMLLAGTPLEEPSSYVKGITAKVPLKKHQEELTREILEYCTSKGLQVAIVAAPFQITAGEMMQFNALEELAAEYGVPFFNTNKELPAIGLDYSTDFYNERHTNIFGAEKFTAYLTAWLSEQFDLPDHRGEEAYAAWEEALPAYHKKVTRARKKVLASLSAS